jgi:translin
LINLDAIESWARENFERKYAAREQALARSREMIRTCARSIRAAHRQEFEAAGELLYEARRIGDQMSRDLSQHWDLYYAGYVQDALKELVEATVVLRMIRGEPLPSPLELGVPAPAFMNGLAEAVGELRRYLLDRLRRGDAEGCEVQLEAMDEIYNLLITLDYPDAITGGLRRTTDIARGILEKTRGDLTTSLRQDGLERLLAELQGRLDGAIREKVAPPASAPRRTRKPRKAQEETEETKER